MRLLRLACVLMVALLAGCGGGTEGTGLRTFGGTVVSEKGVPVAGARITLLETGDSTTTGEGGEFTLRSDADGEVRFRLEHDGKDAEFSVPEAIDAERQVSFEVRFDLKQEIATVRNLELKAAIIEQCDPFFENRETIRQANRVPAGIRCVLEAKVWAESRPLDGVPVALQRRGCGDDEPWTTLQVSRTGSSGAPGRCAFRFRFSDDPDVCEYRVIAPADERRAPRLTYQIETFNEQRRERGE